PVFFYLHITRRPPSPPLFPYTTLFRSPAPMPEVPNESKSNATSSPAASAPSLMRWNEEGRFPTASDCSNRVSMSLTGAPAAFDRDRKSTRLNSSHDQISYAVFCLKKKK